MGRLRQAPSAVDLGDGLTPRDVPMDTLSSYVTAFGAKPTGEGPCHVPEVNPMGQYRTNRSQTEWTLAHGDDEGVAHTTSGSMPLHAFHHGRTRRGDTAERRKANRVRVNTDARGRRRVGEYAAKLDKMDRARRRRGA